MHRTRVTRKSAQGEMTHRSANARVQPALQRFLVAIGYRAGEAYLSYSFAAYPAGFVKSREINLKSFLVLPKINSLSSLSVQYLLFRLGFVHTLRCFKWHKLRMSTELKNMNISTLQQKFCLQYTAQGDEDTRMHLV